MNTMTTLVCGTAAVGCLSIFAPMVAPAPPQDSVDLQYTGKVEELWVNAPGRVQFRLRGRDQEGKSKVLWFETPADKDVNTLFENLALSLIRHGLTAGVELTVQAKDSSGDDGSVATKAYDVVRLGLRLSN